MEFFNPNSNVDFMRVRRVTMAIAVFLMIGSIIAIATKGLNLALDFTGGTLVEVTYGESVEQPTVVGALEAAGIRGALVQRFDSTNFSIRLAPDLAEEVAAASRPMRSRRWMRAIPRSATWCLKRCAPTAAR
ncbi:hypothetical protein [Alkalisalibacterium limincola]|uniref:hypothetical protein n=1 Tax=Alkalisalibacterium limincola TaxID=2699169 RepID=UPI0021057DAD|nr:hypothetical protein [Alkalisalibacterium limincola]